MNVIVLGWDGLDLAQMERFGYADAFGEHYETIDTYVNPYIDAPHTHELWPSMITGLHPDEHGIHAATEGDGVNWDSDVLRTASRVSEGIVPDSVKTWLGKRLRERGVGLEVTTAEYYEEHDISTVFDDGGRAISIPNYETDLDRQHDLDAHRDELWKALDVDKSLPVGMEPQVDRGRVTTILGREAGRRLGQTLYAHRQGHGLVWTWFGLLDSVGHMEPALGEEIVHEGYDLAAGVTETVRAAVDDDTVVLSISDHGIQDGHHTEYATVCADSPEPVDAIDHVFEVADYIRTADLQGGRNTGTSTVDEKGVRDVREDLADLGYIDT